MSLLGNLNSALIRIAQEVSKKQDAATLGADVAANPAVRAAYVPVIPTLEAATLWVYGHSFTPIPGFYCTPNGGEWASRLKRRLGLNAIKDYGASGAFMEDMSGKVLSGSSAFPIGSKGIVVVECEINDAVFHPAKGTPDQRAGFANALRNILARTSAGSKIDAFDASVVATGTWATSSLSNYDGGSVRYSKVAGDTLAFPVTGDTCYVGVAATAATNTGNLGTMSFSVNGVQLASWTAAGQMAANGSTTDMPSVVKITGMNAAAGTSGNKTLTLTVTTGGQNSFVDVVYLPSAAPPPVFVCKDPHIGTLTSQANQDAWAANTPALHALIDSVCAEFPNAHVVDLDPGWDPPTMVAATDTANHFHPNDVGMAQLAEILRKAIYSTVAANDPGVVQL